MALPEHGAGGDIGGLRLFDRQRHRLGVDVEAEAPMAVDHGRGRRFLHDRPFCAGHDMAGLDAVDIGRDCDHAVEVVAGEVGVDAADGNRVGFFLRCAGGPEQRRADARETVGLNDRHGVSLIARAIGRSCLLLPAAWSQSGGREQGRNVLLAMLQMTTSMVRISSGNGLQVPDLLRRLRIAHIAPVLPAYEERFLCLVLILLRQPRTHVVYVTSQPILPRLVDYWLRLVPRVEAEDLRRRLEVVSVGDPRPKPLTAKLLDHPRLLERIKARIVGHERSLIIPFNVSPLERELAVRLGIPVYGPSPELAWAGRRAAGGGSSPTRACRTRSGSRTSRARTTSSRRSARSGGSGPSAGRSWSRSTTASAASATG